MTSDHLRAERDAYRDAFRRAFIAYLVIGHGIIREKANAEAERVMAETERRIAAEHEPGPCPDSP
jgi:hypothetical protein